MGQRLIDADELGVLFNEEFKRTKQLIVEGETHLDTLAEGYAEAWHIVKYIAPTVDAVPVVHGRWIGLEYDGYADGNPVYNLWECSECGEEVRGESVPETHLFCPNCGARMDGGAEDEATAR